MIWWNKDKWWNEWELMIVVKNERWFEEQTDNSIQCCCGIRKEGVMWVSLNQDEEKKKWENEWDGWNRFEVKKISVIWEEGLREECEMITIECQLWRIWERRMSGKVIQNILEDCERVEEIIIKGCERVWIKIMMNKKSWKWKSNEWNEVGIIWWDCQICQVQERLNYFHWDKEHFKSKCKRMDVGMTRYERLLRELNIWGGRCVRLFSKRRCC